MVRRLCREDNGRETAAASGKKFAGTSNKAKSKDTLFQESKSQELLYELVIRERCSVKVVLSVMCQFSYFSASNVVPLTVTKQVVKEKMATAGSAPSE